MKHNLNTHTGPSFSTSNKIRRQIWNIAYIILFKYTPKPMHGWRAFVLRQFGAIVGQGSHIYPGVKIWAPWNLIFGEQCGVASGAILYSQDKIHIGERAVISQGAHLVAGTHDYTHPGFPLITKPITICDNAWIAAEAFIHPGVTIGEGAVIGARSVVTKDMPPWTVCTGHPCMPVKERIMRP